MKDRDRLVDVASKVLEEADAMASRVAGIHSNATQTLAIEQYRATLLIMRLARVVSEMVINMTIDPEAEAEAEEKSWAAVTCSACTKGHGAKLAKPCDIFGCKCFCNRSSKTSSEAMELAEDHCSPARLRRELDALKAKVAALQERGDNRGD